MSETVYHPYGYQEDCCWELNVEPVVDRYLEELSLGEFLDFVKVKTITLYKGKNYDAFTVHNISPFDYKVPEETIEKYSLLRLVEMGREDVRQGRTQPMSEFIEELKERRRNLSEG